MITLPRVLLGLSFACLLLSSYLGMHPVAIGAFALLVIGCAVWEETQKFRVVLNAFTQLAKKAQVDRTSKDADLVKRLTRLELSGASVEAIEQVRSRLSAIELAMGFRGK